MTPAANFFISRWFSPDPMASCLAKLHIRRKIVTFRVWGEIERQCLSYIAVTLLKPRIPGLIAAAEAYPPPATRRSVEHLRSKVNMAVFGQKGFFRRPQD